MVAPADNLLGIGVYSARDAARYARVPTATFSRWVLGTKTDLPVIDRNLASADPSLVTFVDFVQALSIRAIRTTEKVPLQKIREAIYYLRDKHGVEFPLARNHKLHWLRDDIHIEIVGSSLMKVTGKNRGQYEMKEVFEPHLKLLRFGSDGLADRYTVYERYDRESSHVCRIMMDPRVNFGQPVVEGTGMSYRAIADAFRAEGSVAGAADAFGIDPAAVETALAYEQEMATAA